VFEYRGVLWLDALDGDWAVRNKSNGEDTLLDAKRGGKIIYEGFVHTFYERYPRLIPPEKYFKDHPEWFSELNGKRTYKRGQLCLTNEEMRLELVSNLKERLRKNPAANIASVSQNDWRVKCQCARCLAVDREEGSPAGTLLRFVNAATADIEKEFPHVAISTLAYYYTRKPPKYTKPRHNVIVRLCPRECSWATPLADEQNEINKKFCQDLVGWSKICNRLYIWDYVTNQLHYFRPHPNLRVLGPNIRLFAKYGVKGVHEAGAYAGYGADMAELRAWVQAKLLWNPTLDGQTLVDEFVDGYYGPAAEHLRDYLNLIHDSIEATGEHLDVLPSWSHKTKFLSFEVMDRGWAHLKAAEAAVQNDPDLLFRVQVAQLPIMYTFMVRWDEMREKAEATNADWPMPDSIHDVHDYWMKIAKKKNVDRLCHWYKGFDTLKKALERATK
jgi:hypothetical protein